MKLEKIKIPEFEATICQADLHLVTSNERKRRRPQLILLVVIAALATILLLSSRQTTTNLVEVTPDSSPAQLPELNSAEELSESGNLEVENEIKAVEPESTVVAKTAEVAAIVAQPEAAVTEITNTAPVATPPIELPQVIAPSENAIAGQNALRTVLYSRDIKYQDSISDDSYVDYLMQLMIPTKMEELERRVLSQIILRQSRARSIDPIFVAAIVMSGSSFQAHVRSPEGRVGLMQLSPETGKFAAQLAGVRWMPERLSDATYNLGLGLYYFHFLEGLFEGNVSQAVVAHAWDVQLASEARDGKREVPKIITRHLNLVLRRYSEWSAGLQRPEATATTEVKTLSGSTDEAQANRSVRFLTQKIQNGHPEIADAEGTARLIVNSANSAGFDALLIASIIEQGSGFNSQSRSSDGRIGLLQLRSAWGDYISAISKIQWKGEQSLLDPAYNLEFGLAHLKIVQELFQDDPNMMIMAHRLGAKEFIESGKSKQSLPAAVADFSRDARARYVEWKSIFDHGDWEQKSATPSQSAAVATSASQSTTTVISGESAVQEARAGSTEVIMPEAQPTPEVVYFDEELDRLHFLVRQSGVPVQEVRRLAQRIMVASEHDGLHPLLVAAIIKQKSNFFWFAVQQEPVRVGLFQIPVDRAEQIADLARVTWAGADELKNPEYNLRLGISYLRYLRSNFNGNMKLALTAFFWDPIELKHAINRKAAPPEAVLEEVRRVIKTVKEWRGRYRLRPADAQ